MRSSHLFSHDRVKRERPEVKYGNTNKASKGNNEKDRR